MVGFGLCVDGILLCASCGGAWAIVGARLRGRPHPPAGLRAQRHALLRQSATPLSPALAPLRRQVERGPGKAHLHDNIEYLYTSLKSLYRCRTHGLAVVVFALCHCMHCVLQRASARPGASLARSRGQSVLPAASFSVLALLLACGLACGCVMYVSGADRVPFRTHPLPRDAGCARSRAHARERAQPVVPPAGRPLQLPRLFFAAAIRH